MCFCTVNYRILMWQYFKVTVQYVLYMLLHRKFLICGVTLYVFYGVWVKMLYLHRSFQCFEV